MDCNGVEWSGLDRTGPDRNGEGPRGPSSLFTVAVNNRKFVKLEGPLPLVHESPKSMKQLQGHQRPKSISIPGAALYHRLNQTLRILANGLLLIRRKLRQSEFQSLGIADER